jgi:asparagine synthase (glutamine-hydrolysing)
VCGILAILRRGARPLPDRAVIRGMARSIVHRGPDGWGLYTDEHVQLAALRLAVIDPEGGRQPVRGCRDDVIAASNGELYEHVRLRASLEAEGHTLGDRCDTSLVPHLYEAHGERLVEHVHGMFAIALWDARAGRLFLARDRLGIKPLFVAETEDFVLVASEQKALFASGLLTPRIDPERLAEVFSLGYPCPPHSLFAGVRELPPAHTALARAGRGLEAPRRYWRAPFVSVAEAKERARREGPIRMDRAAASLRRALEEAVRSHLVADVPVAAALSGGLDSSGIACLARAVSGHAPATFSLTFPGEAIDERTHADAVAAHLGSAHHHVALGPEDAQLLPEMLWHLELPMLVPGAIGGLRLSGAQRAAGFRVALTGDGADELLGGYDVFRLARVRRTLDATPLSGMQGALLAMSAAFTDMPEGLAPLLVRSKAESARLAARTGGVVLPWADQMKLLDVDRAALLAPSGARPLPGESPPDALVERLRPDLASLDPLDAQLAIELETRLPSWILVISDRSAMAHGIEARVPLLDDHVVSAALAVPADLKMRGLEEKAVLREALRDLLPRSIVKRRKQPFVTPIASWFFGGGGARVPPFVEDLLSADSLRAAGLFAPAIVERLRRELAASREHSADRLRRELVLMLVLGTQLVHALFVRGHDQPSPRFALPEPW